MPQSKEQKQQQEIGKWKVADVKQWLVNDVRITKQEVLDAFEESGIDGESLLSEELRPIFLDNNELIKWFKLTNLLNRMRFISSFKQLLSIDDSSSTIIDHTTDDHYGTTRINGRNNEDDENCVTVGVEITDVVKPLQEAFSSYEITRQKLKQFVPEYEQIIEKIRSAQQTYSASSDENISDKFIFAEKYQEQMHKLYRQSHDNKSNSSLLLNRHEIAKLKEFMENGVTILVLGEVNAGKSAFINALLDKLILPSTPIPCTSTICRLKYSSEKKIRFYKQSASQSDKSLLKTSSDSSNNNNNNRKRIKNLIHRMIHNNRDNELEIIEDEEEIDSPLHNSQQEYVEERSLEGYESVPEEWIQSPQRSGEDRTCPYSMVEVFWPLPLLEHGIEIVDTPGLNENTLFDQTVEQFLPNATAIILVIDLNGAVTHTLKSMLKKIKAALSGQVSTNLFVVCTKADLYEQEDLKRKKEYMLHELAHEFPKLKTSVLDFFHSVSTKNIIDRLKLNERSVVTSTVNRTHTEDFVKLQQSLVKFICGTFELKQDLMHDLIRKNLENGLRYVKNTIHTWKLQPVERQVLYNDMSKSLNEVITEITEWEVQCNSYIQDFKRNQLRPVLENFWKNGEIRIDLVNYLRKISVLSNNYNEILSRMKSHVCSLFLEFYSDSLYSLLEQYKNRLLNFQIAKEAILKLKQIQTHYESSLNTTDHMEAVLIGSNGDASSSTSKGNSSQSIDLKPNYAHQFKYYYKMFSGETMIEKIVRAPFVIPLTALITPIMTSIVGVVHYDDQLIETHVNTIIQSQLDRKRLKQVVKKCTEPLYQVVKEVKMNAYRQISQELNLIRHSLAVSNSTHSTELIREYITYQNMLQTNLHRFISFKETIINEKWAIDFSKIERLSVIARGGMALVSKVEYENEIYAMKQPIASTIQYDQLSDQDKLRLQMDFLNEVSLFIAASRGNHPNVVKFKGAHFSAADGKSYLLIEYCPDQDLRSFLKRNKLTQQHEKLDLVLQCAHALEYLHSQGIMHRDVKSNNFLVFRKDKSLTIKVTDFGVSKSSLLITGTHCGTKLYMAPELEVSNQLSNDQTMLDPVSVAVQTMTRTYSSTSYLELSNSSSQIDPVKCDIYSFAFIMYEIWTSKIPYSDTVEAQRGDVVRLELKIRNEGFRPEILAEDFADCPESYVELMKSCWTSLPGDRPRDMGFVVQRLNSMLTRCLP